MENIENTEIVDATEPEPVDPGVEAVEDTAGGSEDYGFDMQRFNDIIESNEATMKRLQLGPDPLALLEMRLKSAILMFAGERGLLDVELRVQEWLAEGLAEAETEMTRQQLLEGVNTAPVNNIMPFPIVNGDK